MYEYPENDYRYYLMHYAKGAEADNHKYLYKDENGRYIYPQDVRNAHHIHTWSDRPKGRKQTVTGSARPFKTGNGLGVGVTSKPSDEVWYSRPGFKRKRVTAKSKKHKSFNKNSKVSFRRLKKAMNIVVGVSQASNHMKDALAEG